MAKTHHITAPAGFVAAGVKCGIKTSGRADLALIACRHDATAAIVTTRNQVLGEPVRYCRSVLPKGFGRVRAVVINSGCSNVCTGPAGYRDAVLMAEQTARLLGTTARKVLVASTGIIGHRLPMAKVHAGITAAAGSLGRNNDAAALAAIMTTDTRPKHAVLRTTIGGKTVTVAGMVKGSGMIAPSMATLIAVLTTDAAIAPRALHRALAAAMQDTLNAVTIDSDTSTSDTVVLLASGAAGHKPLAVGSAGYRQVRRGAGQRVRARWPGPSRPTEKARPSSSRSPSPALARRPRRRSRPSPWPIPRCSSARCTAATPTGAASPSPWARAAPRSIPASSPSASAGPSSSAAADRPASARPPCNAI